MNTVTLNKLHTPGSFEHLSSLLAPIGNSIQQLTTITMPIFKGKVSAHGRTEEITLGDYNYIITFDPTWNPEEDECKDVDILLIERSHVVDEDDYYPLMQLDFILFNQIKRQVMIFVDENIDNPDYIPFYYNCDKSIKVTQYKAK